MGGACDDFKASILLVDIIIAEGFWIPEKYGDGLWKEPFCAMPLMDALGYCTAGGGGEGDPVN